MADPPPPPSRLQSDREHLQQSLSAKPMTARALSRIAGLPERDVIAHLQHLQKSLKGHRRCLVVTPPTCLDCHFVFHKRTRLTRPGKCPLCRSSHLSQPLFALARPSSRPARHDLT